MQPDRWSETTAPDPFLNQLEDRPLDADDVLLLLLLPMVRVAWVDGAIERGERAIIEMVGRNEEFFPGDTQAVLRRWLDVSPTEAEYGRGFRALRDFLRRRDVAASWHADLRERLADLCHAVAAQRNAGSPVPDISRAEYDTLEGIQALLWMQHSATWGELDAFIEGKIVEVETPSDQAEEFPTEA